MHYKGGDGGREAKNLKRLTQEVPIHPIICFLQIKLEDHITFLSFGLLHIMNNRFEDNCIISGSLARDKAILNKASYIISHRLPKGFIEKRLKPIRPRSLIGLHTHDCSMHFFFSNQGTKSVLTFFTELNYVSRG